MTDVLIVCVLLLHFWQVGADDRIALDKIIDSLTSLANKRGNHGIVEKEPNKIALTVGKIHENGTSSEDEVRKKRLVLILGAGRVCRPAAELLASAKSLSSFSSLESWSEADFDVMEDIHVVVASLYQKDAEEVCWKRNYSSNSALCQLLSRDASVLTMQVSETNSVPKSPPRTGGVI